MSLKFLNVSGDSFNVGYQHGSGATQEIKANYRYYMTMWRSNSGATEKEILDRATTFVPFIKTLSTNYIDELRGVAAGSGLSFEQIVALNCRWEMNYAYLPDMVVEADVGCTAFALTPEITKDGHTYVGQNWDYKPPLQEQCLVLCIEQPGRPSVILITEAGIIGHKGFSSSGIGLGVNFIKLVEDSYAPGIPFLLKARYLLEQPNIDDCLRFLETHPGPNSGNVLLASKEGLAVDVECSPKGMNTIKPVEGVLVHSNHFQVLSSNDKDIGCLLFPDSFRRMEQLAGHLHGCRTKTTSEAIEIGLRDHAGFPNSVCRHQDASLPMVRRWETLVSFYVDLDTGLLKFASGPPCLSTFQSIEKSTASKY
jgi:isopenicillin-N N-acyltransferase like protein